MALALSAPYSSIAGLRTSLSVDAKKVLHDAYVAAHLSAATHAKGAKLPQEPDYVAELIRTGVVALASAWRPQFASLGLTLDILGVFIHQSPMVDFQNPPGTTVRCELGDLLLAVRFPGVAAPSGTAFLTQAKMSRATVSTMAGTDQHHLYSTWPDFELARTTHAAIAIGTAGGQGMLGEIFKSGPKTTGVPVMNTWKTEDFLTLGSTVELEDALADLAAGVAGRSFSPFHGPRTPPPAGTPSANQEWDFLIDYLLSVTFSKAYTRSSIGVLGQPRGIVVTALSGGQVLRWQNNELAMGPAFAKLMPPLHDPLHAYWVGRATEVFSVLGGTGGQLPPNDDDDPFEDRGKGFGFILMTIR